MDYNIYICMYAHIHTYIHTYYSSSGCKQFQIHESIGIWGRGSIFVYKYIYIYAAKTVEVLPLAI